MSEASKPKTLSPNLFPVVGIGASAGGLDAFKRLLKAIPENSGIAYVLVQHLDPTHESMLPEILQKVTKVPVLEISDDIKVKPDHIYILPSNKMLVANDGVLQLSPRVTKKYLEQLPGKPSHNLLKMAKEGLAFELRNLLHKVKKDNVRGIKENIPTQINGHTKNISIEAFPLNDTIDLHYLVLFHDYHLSTDPSTNRSGKTNKRTSATKANQDEQFLRIQQLEKELAQSREDMRAITEDQEAVNEELQSTGCAS